MPEEIEVETSDLQETIDELREEREEREREAKQTKWTRFISLTTALFAVVAAMAALLAGSLVNEAVIVKSDSVLQQAKASDKWAYYQAKGIKAVTYSMGGPKWKPAAAREKAGQAKLKTEAEELETTRDEKDAEAAGLLKRHEMYAWCVTCMQVAISLSAIAALTKRKDVWIVSIVLGAVGTALFIIGFTQHSGPPHPPAHSEKSVSSEAKPSGNEPEGTVKADSSENSSKGDK
jgi:hypothetical protein